MKISSKRIKQFTKALLTLNAFILFLALLIWIFPTKIPFRQSIDATLFKLESRILSAPKGDADIVIIHLPANLVKNLAQHPAMVPYFNNFLDRLNRYKPSALAFIHEDLPDTLVRDVYVKVSLQFLKVRTRGAAKIRKTFLEDFDGFNGELADTIRRNDVLIGSAPFALAGQNRYQYVGIDISSSNAGIEYQDTGRFRFFRNAANFIAGYEMPPKIPKLESSSIPFSPYMGSYTIAPAFNPGPNDIFHPLIWQHENRFLPDLVTLLYARLIKSRLPKWDMGTELQYDFRNIRTGPGGRIQPLIPRSDRKIPKYSLSEILSRKNLAFLRNKIIIMGEDGDATLENTAYALAGLHSGFTAYMPIGSIMLEKLFILLLLVFFVFLFSKAGIRHKILLGVGIFCLLISVQYGFLTFMKIWIPMASGLIFLLLSGTLFISKDVYRYHLDRLGDEKDDAILELGRIQFDNRKFDQAFVTLRRCSDVQKSLELIYNIGIEFQRRNQFNKAISVFNFIVDKEIDFKDASERAQQLSDFMRGKISKSTESGADSTIGIPHIEINRLVLGRYEIEKELGRGAMGIVYLGKDPKIGRSVAIKTLDFSKLIEGDLEKAKARFFQEAKTIGMLNHPNLVMVYDVGEEDEIAFIAMDYVPGENLTTFSKKENLLSVPMVFQLLAQVADALDYAHQRTVIHRDIKPGNIIYNKQENIAKVTDFGIARMMDSKQTRSDIILGSPSYMSPEQLRGLQIDGRSDIFSLGVTFYQLLTGHYPFEGEDLATITYKITKSKPSDIRKIRSELPEFAWKIIEQALQKNPDKRFQTAGEMAGAMRRACDIK